MSKTTRVDHSALRTNQALIIGVLILGFVLALPLLVAFVAAVMVVGTVFPQASLFKRFYRHVLKPAGLVKPDVIDDNPQPHLFAQGLGGVVLTVASLLFVAGINFLAWALVWMVVALAALNLFARFCLGCFIYYQLSKRGVNGFTAQPVTSSQN